MATTGPRRRRSDAAAPRPLPFGPSPGAIGPADPDAASRSVAHALEAVRRHRRPVTLVALALPAARGERELERAASLVRRTVRDTDGLWRDGAASLILILTDVDGPGSEPALARLRMRLRSEGLGDLLMGRAAPPPGIGADELMALARADCRPISRSRPPA
jgi:hypothetical protein